MHSLWASFVYDAAEVPCAHQHSKHSAPHLQQTHPHIFPLLCVQLHQVHAIAGGRKEWGPGGWSSWDPPPGINASLLRLYRYTIGFCRSSPALWQPSSGKRFKGAACDTLAYHLDSSAVLKVIGPLGNPSLPATPKISFVSVQSL
eukprot:scaffold106979_cov18-Tisochrysis_lutea.AAC.1